MTTNTHTEYSQRAADEGRPMNSDEQRADARERARRAIDVASIDRECAVSAATGDEVPADTAREIVALIHARYGRGWLRYAGAAFATRGGLDARAVLRELSDWIACNYNTAPAAMRKRADHLGTFLLSEVPR